MSECALRCVGGSRRHMRQRCIPATSGVALAACLLVWAAPTAGQGLQACAPEKTLGVKLTTTERELTAPLVATHDVEVAAEFTGSTLSETYTPPAGVKVVAAGRSGIVLIVPIAASVPITVSWRQAVDPSDPTSDPEDPLASCTASIVVTLPIVAARPSRAVKQRLWNEGSRLGFSSFAVVPALEQPDLSPLEISARTTSRVRFPSATASPRTMAVPMRTVDQVKYSRTLPDPFHLGVAGLCKLYLLTCGAVFSEVSRPFLDTDALERGVEKADINDGVKLLPRTQPSLEAARYGVTIEARPGAVREGKPRPFGYDVQVRQSGRLVARVRVAGRCVERRLAQGLVVQCRIARRSVELH
jgi:hypothetical protein